jgi:hypothetical protein
MLLTVAPSFELSSLSLERPYAGLLVGFPTTQRNDHIVERTRQWAVQKHGQHVVVIDPVRKPGVYPLYKPGIHSGPRKFLPAVTCQGMFQSGPVRNEPEVCSLLLIIWFKDAFALPIDPGVIETIRKVDRETCACNWTD